MPSLIARTKENRAKIRATKAANPYKPSAELIAQRVEKQKGQNLTF